MFYSHLLLSKKGPLGTIWVAAHCHKRLKKDQVKQTDISSSVDKILRDAVPEFTYRIIAYLLLGVVRIFSKKVDFLFDDCCIARDSLNQLAGINGGGKSREAKHPSTHSITLPKRFELDAFDLEVLGDQEDINCCHVMAREEIMLADTWKEGVERTNKKHHCDRDTSFEAYSSIYTPVRDVFSPHSMDIDLDMTTSRVMSNLESDMEIFRGIKFSLEDHLELMIFGEAEKDSGFDLPSIEGSKSNGHQIRNPDAGGVAEQSKLLENTQTRNHESERESGTNRPSIEGHEFGGDQMTNPDAGKPTELVDVLDKEQTKEKLLKATPLLEETLEPMSFSEVGKEFTLHLPSNLAVQNDGEQIKCPGNGISLQLPERVRSLDRELNAESEEMQLPEVSPLANQFSAKHPISIITDVSPVSKSQGAISTDLMAVCTPSIKERSRVKKKRKCLFDETVVLSNNLVKHWIDNSSDLFSKRRKAPLTAFHSWQAHKISNLPESFLEPLIPCKPVTFKSQVSQKNFITLEPVESVEVQLAEIITQTPVNQVVVESPVQEKSREQTPIAPATPVTHPTSLRSHEVRRVFKPDRLEHASSSESMESELALNEDPDLVASLLDEEITSSAGDTREKHKCSEKTRKVAKYLHARLQHQRKRSGEMFMTLTRVLKGKTRKESARLFYEILVLKTGDYIDVKQEHDFGDILVTEAAKMKDAIGTDDGGSIS